MSMRVLMFAMAFLICAQQATSAAMQKRAALLIGNGNYGALSLQNPGSDVTALAASLARLGFKSQILRDADWQTMVEALRDFITQTRDSEVRLIFFAGHGAQIRGKNYLVPVGISINDEDDVTKRSIDVAEILDRIGRLENGVNIVILDACRNNPILTTKLTADGRKIRVRGHQHGLAPVRAPAGTLVAFSTGPGNVADDNPKALNSLYAKHLLSHIGTPGLTLEQLFKRIRVGVMQDSKNAQRPWEESSLTVDFCFVAGANGACPAGTKP